MQYRTVPKNGDKLSALGFGTMRLPGSARHIDEEEATGQIYSAIEQGVNYIDTAATYHNGKSEPFLGRILSRNGYREKVKLATKLPHWLVKNQKEMERFLDKQLKKLKTDTIDYYLIHNLNGYSWEKNKEKGVFGFLDDALASGKILNAGFSYHGLADDFNKIVDDYDWTFCQIQYNILDTENQAGTAGLKYAASKKMAVMVMEPLRGGNLAKTPPKEIQKILDESGHQWSIIEWSFRWIWNHPEVTVVLSGMNDEDHINQNIQIAADAPAASLSKKDLNRVKRTADTYRKLMKIECTACQYCMPCPSGVNIPGCFEYYNSYHTFNNKRAKLVYGLLMGGVNHGLPTLASQCTECGKCLPKCPQGLDIPVLLKDVEKEMEGILFKPMIWLFRKMRRVRS